MHVEKIIFFSLSAIMLSMSVVVSKQYYAFKEETEKLRSVRDEYVYYLLMMKKNIKDSSCGQGDDNEGDEKKIGGQTESSESFLLVNRDPEYLNGSFQEFLNQKSVEEDEFQMISAEDEKQLRLLRRQLVSSKKTLKKSKKSLHSNHSISRFRKFVTKAPIRDFTFHWPLELHHFWISSLFGPRKKPNGTLGFHYGLDMAALKGTPVRAAAAGKVVQAQYVPGYGNNILLQHNKDYRTRYAHLDSIRVKVGQHVKAGDRIGSVGDTGCVRKNGHDASHLHFEIYRSGRQVNPLRYLFT